MDSNKMIVVYFSDGTFRPNEDKESKLRSFFEDENLTNGGEIEKLNLNRNNGNQAFIYFKEKEVAERVAQQRNIRIKAYKFNVKFNNRRVSESEDRDPYEELNTDDDCEKAAAMAAPKKQPPLQQESAKHNNSFSDFSNKKISSHLNRRPIIIDGNNVGMSHGRSKLFSCRGLQIAVDYFINLGHLDITVVVPRKRQITKDDIEIPNMNPEILIDLEKKGQLVYVSNKVYDDETILELAIRKNAVVISNDQFRDLKGASPGFANYLKNNNTLEYVLSGDIFFINQKPFGQFGPTLDEVLTVQDGNKLEAKIAPVSDADTRPKKDSGFKVDNKEKANKIKNEDEIYLFIPDIKNNGESIIEVYFADLLGVEHIKMLFLELENKTAIALNSVPLSKISDYLKKHKNAVNEMPSLGDIELRYIPKTKQVLIRVNTKDLDEVKLLINQIMSPEKLSALDITSKETSDLFVLTLKNLKSVDKWLNDENDKIKSNSSILSNFGPYSKEIIGFHKNLLAMNKNKKSNNNPNTAINNSNNKNDSAENNNLVLIKHSYLYNYLKENKNKVEEKFKVKLLFLGVLRENGDVYKRLLSRSRSQLSVDDAESSSDCDSDDSEVSNVSNQSQAANKKNNNRRRARNGRKYFRIAIRTKLNKQFDHCKNYMETLNENFRIKFITADEKNKHFEYLINRKIRELKKEEDSNTNNNDDEDELFDDIEMSYVKKFNKITVFLTSANEKNRKKIDEILKQLEIVSKEIRFKQALTNVLKRKKVEFESNFNARVYINFDKNTAEVHCLKLDEEDLKKVCECIENIEEENKLKMVTIRPGREEEIVCKYLNLKELIEVNLKPLGVFIDQDKRSFFLLKAKNQNNLDEAANLVRQKLAQIESQLEYECRKYPLNLFNFIKSSRWIKSIVGKHNVSMKIPSKLMKPILSLVNKRGGDLRLFICHGNIIETNTSTIVNSVNVDLQNKGGVAKAIEDAAGQAYKEACEKLTKPLNASKVYLTTSGNLDCCQTIINVVAPVYCTDLTKADLIIKYQMCIDEALKNNYESIAFPLLGAGIFGWPIDLSLSALVECVNNYTGFKRLKEVYLVEFNQASFREILGSISTNLNKYSNLSVEYNFIGKQKEQQKQPMIMRPPLSTLNTEVEAKWYWVDDSKQWKEYRSEIARELNRQKKNNVSLFEMTIDNQRYKIDLTNKLQINTKTGNKRSIMDQVPTKSYVQWSWIEDGNRKQPYCLSDNKEIESAYKQKQPHLDLVIKRHRDDLDNKYRIDFARMQQINMKTGFLRPLIREKCEVPVRVVGESNEDEDDENSQADESSDKITYKIWFVGRREDLSSALREFDSRINAINCTDKIEQQSLSELPDNELKSNGFRAKSRQEWSKNGVEIKQSGDSIELSGKVKRDVSQVKEELTRMLLQKKNIEYPSYWDLSKNKSDNYCELIDVGCTPERAQIEAEFRATCPKSQIIRIQMIQNTRIYKYYYEEKNYLLNKSKKRKVNELFLWHGTRNVVPSTVYSSDKCGLDFHHSNEGMWGRGIYLAKNASYSHAYSHTLQDGSKQFLYCSVLIGDSVKLAADNSLRLPPFKDQMSGSGERYDSVEGFTGGSQIFIVYENQKVYPAYLITFK